MARQPLALLSPIFLVPFLAVFAVAQDPVPSSPDWVLEDDHGDQSLVGYVTGPGGSSTPMDRHVDLWEVRITNETEFGFEFVIVVDDLRVQDAAAGLAALDDWDLYVDFEHEATEARYDFNVEFEGVMSPDASNTFVMGAEPTYQSFWTCGDDDCVRQPLEAWVDDAQDAVHVWIPKTNLLGTTPSERSSNVPSGLPSTLLPGDRLVDIRVWSSGGCPPCSSDDAPEFPDEAPPYVMRAGTANTVVALAVGAGGTVQSLEPGRNQSLPLVATNHAAAKRILQFEYDLEGPADKLGLYRVAGPASLQLPGGQSRNLTLSLDVDDAASASDGVSLVARAISVGHPEEIGFAKLLLLPGSLLGPESNVLYFHAYRQGYFGAPVDDALCARATLTTLLLYNEPCVQGLLSPFPTAPGALPDGRIQGSARTPGVSQVIYMDLDAPIGGPVRFAANGTIDLALKLAAPVDAAATQVQVTIQWGNEDSGGVLFDERRTVTVTASGTLVSFTGPARLDESELLMPAGTSLFLRVGMAALPSPTYTAAWVLGGMEVVAKESSITLPLADLPPELDPRTGPLPFQFNVAGDAEEFVNPGEARLFNVTLLNQDLETRRIAVEAASSPGGWVAQVRPGAEFELEPGDSVVVGVLLYAPAAAHEGDEGVVVVNATADTGQQATVRVVATVTTGIDLADDSVAYRVDSDAQAKVVHDNAKDTPAPGAAAALAAIASLVLLGRRRKA